MKPSIILIVALVASVCTQAQAQRREVNSQVAQACKTELQQLCQGQKGQQAEQCLKNNQANLSSQCKSALQTPQK